ncbi:hypothetical protein Tco_1299182, partial [Tanacetum coccineum]
ERESKLYDEFWYIYFSARSDNSLVLLELDWRKFAMEVKVAKDLHNTNFDHLYAYLRQHEAHANGASGEATISRSSCLGLVVPSFLPFDDPIASLNKAMAFISTSFAS